MFRDRLKVEAYEFGAFRLDLTSRQLLHDRKRVPLPALSFDLLKVLIENRGEVLKKEDLMREVWAERYVEENNLSVRISWLRKAFGAPKNNFIETVPGYGYRFVGRVRAIFSDGSSRQGKQFDSLAVLPLVNQSDQPRLNYLCDGITESLITTLSHITDLRVMARATVFRYQERALDPQKAGKELRVSAVLRGRVSQLGNSLILDIEMIDVEDGSYLWGAKYRRGITDLVILQEDLAKEISDHLRIRLSKVEETRITKRFTNNPQAHHLYMKGRYFLNTRTVRGVQRAIEYFTKAIRYDPRYSLAHAGLADSYVVLSSYGLLPPRMTMPKAKAAALKALEIDDQLAEAHVSLGNIESTYELDWKSAERAFRRALEINPYYSLARQYYANFLSKVGRMEEAFSEITAAYDIDPLSLSVNLTMGKTYHYAGRFEEAIKKGHEILEIEPRFGPANGLIGLAQLAMGQYQDAVRELKTMIAFSSGDYRVGRATARGRKSKLPDADPEALALLGYAYAQWGKRPKAIQILNQLVALKKKRYVQAHTIALVHLGLERHDETFEWLEKAVVEKTSTVTFLKVCRLFGALRGDDRYKQLVQRLGL